METRAALLLSANQFQPQDADFWHWSYIVNQMSNAVDRLPFVRHTCGQCEVAPIVKGTTYPMAPRHGFRR
jgi:hypothetical protein